MKKTIITALILLLSLLPVLAMGNSEKNSEVTEVVIWHSAQGSNSDVFDSLIEEFNNTVGKDQNIHVESIYQGKANDVLTKVNAASGTSSLPDIAMMDATAATDMNASEYLVTIDALGVDTSKILESGLSSYTSEKGLLALPFNASALLYYYNKTLYDSLGLTAPRTIADMAYVASKTGLKDSNGKLTRAGFIGIPTTFELSTFIGAQNGISFMLDNRNGHDGGATKAIFKEEGTYKTFLQEWKKVFDTGFYSTATSGTTEEFTSGRAAAFLASSSKLATIINSAEGFEVGVAAVPMVNENATGGTVISGGALFAFTDNSAVKTVLEYLISADVQALWSEGTGYVPVNTDTYNTESYKAFLKENPLYSVASDSLLSSNPNMTNVWVPSAYSIYYSFQTNILNFLNGTDVDTTVSEMESIINSAIKTYRDQNK
ncbi:MAG: extracellular solute-binding protein [Sphaerochaetaceae bacterium]|nr:extracellular solute-binding protein [Sphaerochaetaceae bacterium]